MSAMQQIRRLGLDVAVAFQFLTRIPMPSTALTADSLSGAVKFFPLVGLVVGSGAVLIQKILIPHMVRPLVALAVLIGLLCAGTAHAQPVVSAATAGGSAQPKSGESRNQVRSARFSAGANCSRCTPSFIVFDRGSSTATMRGSVKL